MPNKKQLQMPFEGETKLDLFKPAGKEIRKVFHNDEWHFSVTDVIEAITDSSRPRQYWVDLKAKLSQEGMDELYGKIVQLKMPSPDGKERTTDTANTETLFRIMQSIPSPKAEPFKRWLAKVGFERLEETSSPEKAIQRAIIAYKLKGYPDDWIDARIRTILSRKELTGEWAKRGVKDSEYGILTGVISKETFNLTPQQHKDHKGIDKKDNLRDHMTDLELILTMLGEKSTTSIAVAHDSKGFDANKLAAHTGGQIAGNARKSLERELGRPVVSSKNYLPDRDNQDQLIDEGGKRLNE
ncbi:MAG: Bro-N domain-containing protein [Dehalococcoidia bacterium]|nr:Bro-N domain-containing protein [Dehalococcoidia bacterium]